MYYEDLLSDGSKLNSSKEIESYHDNLKKNVKEALDIAYDARREGYDPKKEVEIIIAQDVASRTEGLVGPKGVASRLREMKENKYSKDKIVLEITKEICNRKFMGDDLLTDEDIAEQALRTALAYQTEGITAAPIEGISKVKIKTNTDGSQFLAVYYAGPIRSAGGTAQGVSLLIADVIREELNLNKYIASEKEVERMLEEVRLYDKIMHLQLPTSDEEIRFAWKNMPIMIDGDPTEKAEVGGYRNIVNISTNRVRGGACLVLNDGLVGRSKKLNKKVKDFKLEGWSWLDEIANKKHKKRLKKSNESKENRLEAMPDEAFASDALMGRPTFSDATAHGGFRLRYGHARNTGIAAVGVHPGSMAVVNDFLAPGTHIRTERPGKGGIVTPVDTIRGPIVKLRNGNVIEVNNYEQGVKLRDEIDEVLFLGDILIGFGEFIQNNYNLVPVGYNEEWWVQEMIAKGWESDNNMQTFQSLIEIVPSEQEAIDLSKKYSVALHPKYIPAWKYLTIDEIRLLKKEIWKSKHIDSKIKDILEKAFILHTVEDEGLSIKYLESLKKQLPKEGIIEEEPTSFLMVKKISEIKIEDIMGTTVGARMGRPEKSKARDMKKSIHGLFPLGYQKGKKKDLSDALSKGIIEVYAGSRECPKCKIKQWETFCKKCGNDTLLIGKCNKCKEAVVEPPCDNCGSAYVNYKRKYVIDLFDLTNDVRKKIGQLNEKRVKLKDQVENTKGIVEIIEKGILRAENDLRVFRDGTIRYDATDAPLTHFYPNEIGTDWEKLKELGYDKDVYGQLLKSDHQLLELKPQDIIINHSAINHFKNVGKFVDRELEEIYGKKAFYNIKGKQDIVGQLIIGLAPHTSAGVIGRIIGFNESSVCWAHPYWHASKRRNCDGDEDGIILLMDAFLNFSKEYLPNTRGSKMDTPLVLVVTLNPYEVDDEVFKLDTVDSYPLKLYENSKKMSTPIELMSDIELVQDRLGKIEQFQGFRYSHHTSNISDGPLTTKYKDTDQNIREKLDEQLKLGEIIKAVDVKNSALRILEKHSLPDLMGNLRAFASQTVWCGDCQEKYRRIPLRGECRNTNCNKGKLRQTVFPKSVSKYFDICQMLVNDYELGIYYENRLDKIKMALDSHFKLDNDKDDFQLDLTDWF